MTSSAPESWVIEKQIEEAAYYKWQNAGCPHDKTLEFWLEAQQEVLAVYGLSINSELVKETLNSV